jgi:tetratricopeptide (TPR) repeat protein
LAEDQLIQELNRLIEDHKGKEALDTSQRGLKAMDSDIANYADELGSLKKIAKDLPKGTSRVDLSEGEQRLAELKTRRKDLQDFSDKLNEALQEASSPEKQQLRAKVLKARLLENDGEIEKAIQLYESIAQKEGDQSISSHVKKLKERWQAKDENHRRARNFIYGAWPNYRTSAEMKAHMDEARKAFQTCRDAGDKLSPVKLLKANIAHTDQLNKEKEGLEPEKNEDDRDKFQTIADVADDLGKLTEGINAFLNDSK